MQSVYANATDAVCAALSAKSKTAIYTHTVNTLNMVLCLCTEAVLLQVENSERG